MIDKQKIKHLIGFAKKTNRGLALYQNPLSKKLNVVLGPTVPFQTDDLASEIGFCISSYNEDKRWMIQGEFLGDFNQVYESVEKEGGFNSLDSLTFFKSSSNLATQDQSFQLQVSKAVTTILNSDLDKVVLSRIQNKEINDTDVLPFFQRLTNAYSNCFISLVSSEETGTWIGATPETLLCKSNNRFFTMALAGTQNAEGVEIKEAVWRQKEIEEQAYVSRYIINCFKEIRLREFHENGPKTIKAGNLLHLKTDFEVDMQEVNNQKLDQEMLGLLHPTSAVCGMPLSIAQQFLNSEEPHDRKYYSGYLGPVNIDNATSLYVNLRCCELTHQGVSFYAGAGITEDSDPVKEWEETELKCKTLNALLQ